MSDIDWDEVIANLDKRSTEWLIDTYNYLAKLIWERKIAEKREEEAERLEQESEAWRFGKHTFD